MKGTWILDVIIKDGTFVGNASDIESAMWFVVSADGSPQPFSTNQTSYSEKPSWNYPARLILELSDINRAYIYLTLCTYGKNGNGVVAVARCRLGLRYFPLGSPKQISFPLMHVKNSSLEVINLRVEATLSKIAPKFQVVMKQELPGRTQQPGNMSMSQFKYAPQRFSSHY